MNYAELQNATTCIPCDGANPLLPTVATYIYAIQFQKQKPIFAVTG